MADDPVIIGAPKKTVDERMAAYNEERKALDEKYGFVLMADAYIDAHGLIKARPSLLPVENIPKVEDPASVLADDKKV